MGAAHYIARIGEADVPAFRYEWSGLTDVRRVLQTSDPELALRIPETVIWLTEVAPQLGKTGQRFIEHLADANHDANPELMRLAVKLATGAGKTTVTAMLIAWQSRAQAAGRVVGAAHRAAEGDRCLYRRQGGLRVSLRQAIRGQENVRVAGPFTVESLSPHRVLGLDENDELIDPLETGADEKPEDHAAKQSFPQMIL
jgi:hypothetical protein